MASGETGRMNLGSKKVAITGATGFLGQYLVRALLERGATPIAVVRNPELARPLSDLGVDIRTADLADAEAMAHSFEGIDCVIANAGLVSLTPLSWPRYLDANVEGTIHSFEAMRAAGVRRAIQISATGIYRSLYPPINEQSPKYGEAHSAHRLNGYKVSKALAEETAWRYAAKYEIALTALRPSVIYGAGDQNFTRLHKRLMRIRPLAPYPRFVRIGLVYAGDVAEAAMLSLENAVAAGKAYNVAGPDIDLWEFARAWMAQDFKSSRGRLPIPIGYRRIFSTEVIRKDLGWLPRDYDEGIRETLALESG
jgi:dihydroflavonol-4-reductase